MSERTSVAVRAGLHEYSHEDAEEVPAIAAKFMDIHLRHWPEFEGACEVRQIESEPSAPSASGPASEAASTRARAGRST